MSLSKTKPCPPSLLSSIFNVVEYNWEKEEEDFRQWVWENNISFRQACVSHIFARLVKIHAWLKPSLYKRWPWREYLKEIYDEAMDRD